MKPYNEKYSLDIMKKYEKMINECKVENFILTKEKVDSKKIDGYLYSSNKNLIYTVLTLKQKDNIIMRLDFKEIEGTYETIKMARGKVGIVGLGIGYSAIEIASKKEVSEVIVYEKSSEIVEIFNKNFKDKMDLNKQVFNKIKIIKCDAFEAEKNNFDFFFVDIYNYKLNDKVVYDYKKFNEIHKIYEYSFFGVEEFLLSCSYNEIVWVYIPENWMAMSKSIAASLESSGYINDYVKLEDKLVSDILAKFKDVLNDGEEE